MRITGSYAVRRDLLRSGAKLHQGTGVYPGAIEFVGMTAAALTTAAFFPQAIKTIRTRETAGLSLVMYLMLVLGVTMWLVYGLMIGSLPLILGNAVVLVPQAIILMLLLVQRWREAR
jgi:MtN3 and saliva related transmembrane protein